MLLSVTFCTNLAANLFFLKTYGFWTDTSANFSIQVCYNLSIEASVSVGQQPDTKHSCNEMCNR